MQKVLKKQEIGKLFYDNILKENLKLKKEIEEIKKKFNFYK